MRQASRIGLIFAALALGGCGASPPPRYHALLADPAPLGGGGAAMLVEFLPVAVPQRLDRDGLVLGGGGGAPLDVRDNDRWAAPLADEMRQVVADALWRRLRAADTYRAPVAPGASPLPQYRLALRIERFDAVPGRSAAVEGSWTVRRLPQGSPAACRAGFAVPLPGNGSDAAVAALAEGAGRLGERIAASLGRLDRGEADPCGGE
ncbi:PqiC family protein [Phaeospirillum tilakii]|uniref:Membrane integrity-associated transporter subunit PqiC n=1 Tax=Phaeospirillum tilakii TaxID=741673 RepID=A0ABW5CAJ2_9PROT